jgi:hypothetical protein
VAADHDRHVVALAVVASQPLHPIYRLAGRVQVSESTRRLLGEPFLLEERGALEVEGAGELKPWFLAGRNSASN